MGLWGIKTAPPVKGEYMEHLLSVCVAICRRAHQLKALTLVFKCSSLKMKPEVSVWISINGQTKRSLQKVPFRSSISGTQLHVLPSSRKDNGGMLCSSGCF